MPMPGYLSITAETQGAIEGEVNLTDREGTIEVLACQHTVKVPTSSNYGMSSGGRIHLPISITKVLDRSSPMLQQALCTNELLTEVNIDWYRTDGAGMDEMYYKMKLSNAQITAIHFDVQNTHTREYSERGHLETITMIYDQIIWSHEVDGVEFEDTWTTG